MRTFLLLSALALFSSCAIMLDGNTTKIHIYEGKQKGVSVYYNNEFVGFTPCIVRASKKKAKTGESYIELRKEGYKSRTIDLSRKAMPGYIVADVLLAVFPLFIDLATGAFYKVEPDEIKSDLSRSGE